ncbi:hypothetical protein [Chondromyces apiculatus]|uniref:Uncharacterized protein n=1 Tax=Chondromyces apiculatus DSM 436 TaxID=1192034 RepID=A0A017SWN9_9BACT|nr:hypothetical protein [Chondromyces apiculatus]EYF01172.1 Hypothetical protein CAP_8595 [Chondromyces apiculatus DSM 436]
MSHAERITLLTAQRPALLRLVQEARQGHPDEDLAAYLATVREPSGYLLAVALKRRFGHPDPETVLRHALLGQGPSHAFVAGITTATTLAEVLGTLSPNLVTLSDQLRGTHPPDAPGTPLRVLVAARGGAEIFAIPELSPS